MINDLKRYRFGKQSEAYHHPDQQQFDFLQDVEPEKVIKLNQSLLKNTRFKCFLIYEF